MLIQYIVLPEGSRVLGTADLLASAWTKTSKIAVQLPGGKIKEYFLKCAKERGEIMMKGEYSSMNAIYELMPGFAPRPHGWSRFASSGVYFLLMD